MKKLFLSKAILPIMAIIMLTMVGKVQSQTLSASISSSTNVSCNGGCNGTATVSASGGTPSYTYSWNTTPVQTATTATGLCAGTYTVTVTDAASASASASVTITQPFPLGLSLSSTNVSCKGGNDRSASISATGGIFPYNYLWSDGQHTQTAVNLTIGVYSVTVTDANGCTDSKNVTITQPATALTVSIAASTNVSCFGGNNGSATVTASGGTTPYTGCSWSTIPVQTTQTATGLSAGTYTVTVTDANNCTGTASVTITQPVALAVNITASVNPICAGTSTTLTASGATTYLWNGGSTANPLTVTPTVTTTYMVTGTTTGCTGTASILITVPNPMVIITASANPVCAGNSTTLTASGASTYLWNGGSTANPLTVTPTSTTTYTVTGYDVTGCPGTASITITVPNPIVIITASANPVCAGISTTLTAGGATTYLWNDGSTANPLTVTPTSTTTYTVTGYDVTGCPGTASISITVLNPMVSITASANPICTGNSTTLTASGASTYLWNGGSTANPSMFTPTSTTTYAVTGTDLNGCPGTASIIVTVNQPPTVSISASADTVCSGISTTLTANGATTYLWDDGSLTIPLIVTPTVTTIYMVTGTDASGSTGTASIIVTVNPIPMVSITLSVNHICIGDSTTLTASGATTYLWNGGSTANPLTVIPTVTTTYTVIGTDASGSTGTSSITVTVISIDTSVTVSSVTLTANATSAIYQWINCQAMTLIPGQTNQSFTATVNGYYAVIVTQDGCSDTSSCYHITNAGISEYGFADAIHIYPNPATNNLTIISQQKGVIEITNIQGQLIETLATTGNKTTVDVSAFPSGVYFVKVKTDKGVESRKFIKL